MHFRSPLLPRPFSQRTRLIVAIASALGFQAARADVQMPGIFGDHMVLQQEARLPIWGKAAPNEEITVKLGAQNVKTKAGADGRWRVDLAPLPAGTPAQTLNVAGKNTLTFSDVLVGDVWVCSGQSNMEFGMSRTNHAGTDIPQANDSELRLFLVPHRLSHLPKDDIQGHWEVCTPATVKNFTAVGYFFARDLRAHLHRPFGLIGTYWGGTPAEAWTSLEGLQKDPELAPFVEIWQKRDADYAQNAAAFPAAKAAYDAENQAWQEHYGKEYAARTAAWRAATEAAKTANQPLPPPPKKPAPQPKEPAPPDGDSHSPCVLNHGMVAPLQPFAIKGAIWYQGESNADHGEPGGPDGYRVLFARMIADWREHWGQGNFPFLFLQIANMDRGPGENWPRLRASQAETLTVPQTGMAVTIDLGMKSDIHPTDKFDVGLRLAQAARKVAYGEKVVGSGPLFSALKIENGKARVTFQAVGSGLKIGTSPWTEPGGTPLPADRLVGFFIAGEDRHWVPAEARIEGDSVLISSAEVPQPVAVRYGWASNPICNLYNQENLPASPFRTDTWPAVGR